MPGMWRGARLRSGIELPPYVDLMFFEAAIIGARPTARDE